MKSFLLVKKRHGSRAAPRLSLFPFLAVLICTMGALMLLLLFVTRQARLQAAREAAAKNAEKQSKFAADAEMVQWRVDQLKASQKATAAQLADARLVLGHIEDHSRRLRAEFENLTAQAKKAAAEGLKPGHFAAPGEDELRKLEAQIAEAQQRLAQAQRAATSRPKSYAIVPYNGPNSTRRRPIYIECRSNAVVLQPENIVFDEADFDEPLGPGNPLAAAVRAAREQMLLERSIDPRNDGEPYPLLLVRPDGILAYDCALAAMKSWSADFGYELINADWQLKYPPADPNVARAVAQAVELARQEHARLIAAAPNKYGKRPRAGDYRSSLAGQSGAGSDQGKGRDGVSPGFYSSKPADRYGQGYAGGGPSDGSNGSGGGNGNSGGRAGRGGRHTFGGDSNGVGDADDGEGGGNSATDEEFAANNPYQTLPVGGMPGPGCGVPGGAVGGGFPGGAGGGGIAGGGMGGPAGAGGSFASGGGLAGGTGVGPGSGQAGTPGSDGSPGGQSSSALAGGGGGMSGANSNGVPTIYSPSFGQDGAQQGVGWDQRAQASAGPPGAAGAQANGQTGYQGYGQSAGTVPVAGVARPDGYITGRPQDGNPDPQPPQRPDPASGVAMVPTAPLRPGEWRPSDDQTPPKPDPEEEKKKKKKHPYDDVQPDHNQADWALRNARSHAAAISRPVNVACYPDRVVILPEQPGGEPRVVVCDNDNQRNADKFVAAIWEVMDSWGMAGREMYWRPVLNFHVAPGGEPRMSDLARALEGSGLVIQRKQ